MKINISIVNDGHEDDYNFYFGEYSVYYFGKKLRISWTKYFSWELLKSWKHLRFVTRGERLIKSALDEN